jgi:hypothetical protein
VTDDEVLPTYDSVVRDMPRIMADLKAAQEKRETDERDTAKVLAGGEPR